MYGSPIETVENIWSNIWCILDWIWSQSCRNTVLLHTVDQLVRNAKNETVCVPNWGLDKDRMELYQIVKARVCLRGLLPKILRSSSQFYEIQSGDWPSVACDQEKTVGKWELNTCDNFMNLRADFFVGRCNNVDTT